MGADRMRGGAFIRINLAYTKSDPEAKNKNVRGRCNAGDRDSN